MAIKPQLTEATIQTAVWQVELGKGRLVVQWVAAVLAAALVTLAYTGSEFRGLEKREAMDQAQLARNLFRGEGYVTSVIRPLSLWHLQQQGWAQDDPRLLPAHPDLVNPPVYPQILAWLFKLLPENVFTFKPKDEIMPAERWVILPFGQACFLVSLLLVYLWTKQMFDRRVAGTAALLLLFSDTLWAHAISGTATSLLSLLFLLATGALYLADRRLSLADVPNDELTVDRPAALGWPVVLMILSAVVMGVACLTRYRVAMLVGPLALYVAWIFRGRKAALWVVLYLALVAAAVAPWAVHNWQVSGTLFGLAKYSFVEQTPGLLGDVLPRSYDPAERLVDATTMKPLAVKFATNAREHLLTSLKLIGSDFLIGFFIAGLLYGFRRGTVAHLRLVVLGGLGAAVVGMSLLGLAPETGNAAVHGGNLLVLLLPMVAVFGVAFFYLLLDRIQFRMRLTQTLAVLAFVAINVSPIIFTLLPPRRGKFAYPPYIPPVTHVTAQMYEPTEFGASDLPWSMAWYGDRRTLWLPMSVEEFYEINDFVAPRPGFAFVMLTPYMLDRPFQAALIKGEYKGWSELVRGQLPERFPLKSVGPIPPGRDQLLITDKPRWLKPEPAPEPKPEPAPEPKP